MNKNYLKIKLKEIKSKRNKLRKETAQLDKAMIALDKEITKAELKKD